MRSMHGVYFDRTFVSVLNDFFSLFLVLLFSPVLL